MNRFIISGLAVALLAIQPGSVNAQDSGSAGTIEEITVTAQKRSESAQEIPVAISAFTGDTIEKMGLSDISEVAQFTPNVTWSFGTSRDTPDLSIRGASAFNQCCANSKSPVGFYLDEVYQPSNVNLDIALFDMERVEILRGPQGTLFGRNSVAGAYSVYAKRPTDELSGYVKGEFGDYDYYRLEGAISGAFSDSFKVRLAGMVNERDEGLFFSRTLNTDYGSKLDSGALRLIAQFEPNDEFDALLHLSYSYDKGQPTGMVHVSILGTDPSCSLDSPVAPNQTLCTAFDGYTDDDGDPWTTDEGATGARDSDGVFGAFKFNYDFGSAVLSSVTGFTDYNRKLVDQSVDARAEIILQADTGGDVTVFSQELRLASTTDAPLQWIGGLYYAKDELGGAPQYWFDTRDLLGAYLGSTFDQETSNWAAFGSVNYNFSDDLRLNVGLRYTDEEIDFSYESLSAASTHTNFEDGTFGPPAGTIVTSAGTVPGPTNPTNSTSNDSIDFKVSLDYFSSDSMMVFGSIARGHKSGGFWADYTDDVTVLQPYDEEQGTTYEIGFKSNPRDNVQLNGTVFFSQYDDLQVTVQSITPAGLPANFIENAGEAETSGAELELMWLPTDSLTINAGVGYLDSELTSLTSNDPAAQDSVGQALGNAPEWTLSGNIRYEFPVGQNGLYLALQGDGNFQSKGSNDLIPSWRTREDRTLFNASVSLLGPDEMWEIRAWAKNLTDEEYRLNASSYLDAWAVRWLGDPRMVGVSGTYRFGE